jgi:DNA repair protein RadC
MSKIPSLKIKEWAEEDRPREKLLLKGISALTDAELIAIIIGSGNADESAVELSRRILRTVENNLNFLGKLSVEDLKKFKGIGEAKAIGIVAALELGRRRKKEEILEKQQIQSSIDVFEIFYPLLCDIPHEEFWVLLLNRSNKVIESLRISQGGVSGTVIDLRLILKPAIEKLASGIVLCHNHPSGNLKPSENDLAITKKVKEAATVMDFSVIDHIIVCDRKYFSFADEGLI